MGVNPELFMNASRHHSRHILLVEDSASVASLLTHLLRKSDFAVTVCQSKEETLAVLNNPEAPAFFAAILDLQLHDCRGTEIIDTVLEYRIPSMVLTGDTDPQLRAEISKKNIVNYFSKRSFEEVKYAIEAVARLGRNLNKKALVVDDSKVYRGLIAQVLENQLIECLQAADTDAAFGILTEHPDINLILVDFVLPGMYGDEFTIRLRKKIARKDLVIIAISKATDTEQVARFLKIGANDFIHKPFSFEEFLCRVNMNLDNLDLIHSIMDLAHKDYLSNLANRRYFMEMAQKRISELQQRGQEYALVMMDIDFFKKVNDNWGHKAGDRVIQEVARLLNENTKGSDLVARFGGEEFCLLLANISAAGAWHLSDRIRSAIAAESIAYEREMIQVTVSAGVSCDPNLSLEQMIARADEMLYRAKSAGRNQVHIDQNMPNPV
ncbi:MAG: diguanylate cyclase [Leptospiraceae bacterium]|nr:diguanylate cyclase [Leptospiraceae bacterium]